MHKLQRDVQFYRKAGGWSILQWNIPTSWEITKIDREFVRPPIKNLHEGYCDDLLNVWEMSCSIPPWNVNVNVNVNKEWFFETSWNISIVIIYDKNYWEAWWAHHVAFEWFQFCSKDQYLPFQPVSPKVNRLIFSLRYYPLFHHILISTRQKVCFS